MKSCTNCGSTLPSGTEKFCPYCGKNLSDQVLKEGLVIDCLLPIALNYNEATKVKVENSYAVRVSNASLDFHPYYLFEYVLDVRRTDPTGKNHQIQNEGIHLVDALTGTLISASSNKGFKNLLSNIIPKDSKVKGELEPDNDFEKNQIVKDLKNIEPIYKYLVPLGGADYSVNIVEDTVSLKISEKSVLQRIKKDSTVDVTYKVKKAKGKVGQREMTIVPTYSNITIKRKCMIYFPKWIIIFKVGGMPYKRKVLASSGTVVVDEIAFCPRHLSLGRIWNVRKQTHAVCEICGNAYCNEHIYNIGGSYYCEQHRAANKRDQPIG